MAKFSMQGKHKIKECDDCGELYCVECSDAFDSDHFCSAKCANSNFQDNNWPIGQFVVTLSAPKPLADAIATHVIKIESPKTPVIEL